MSIYIDGIYLGSTTITNFMPTVDSIARLRLMQPGAFTVNQAFQGKMAYAAFFQKDMSPYAKMLANNPWQLYQGLNKSIYFNLISSSFTQAAAGGLALAGATLRQTNKPVAGVLTSAGVTTRLTSKLVAGVLAFAGTLSRIVSRFFLRFIKSNNVADDIETNADDIALKFTTAAGASDPIKSTTE